MGIKAGTRRAGYRKHGSLTHGPRAEHHFTVVPAFFEDMKWPVAVAAAWKGGLDAFSITWQYRGAGEQPIKVYCLAVLDSEVGA